MASLVAPITHGLNLVYVVTWDNILTVINWVTPSHSADNVVPEGHAGAHGKWPEFVAPGEGDSRSPCPALNAMANHGILPHDGKNIKFVELGDAIRKTCNFSSSFCYFVPHHWSEILKKDYKTGAFDLAELALHNGIEHDASLTRRDTYHDVDQAKPYLPYIEEILAPEGEVISPAHLAELTAKRRTESQQNNPEYTLAPMHKAFSALNSGTMLTIFGGRKDDLDVMLKEERFPEGWQPRIRGKMGLTMATLNVAAFKIESGARKILKAQEKAKKST